MISDELFYGTQKYHKKFIELCEPLRQYLGITAASCIRVRQDGAMEHVFSNCKWMELAIEKNYFNQNPAIVHPDNMHSGFSFVVTSKDQEYQETMLHEAIHNFHFHHGFCYVEKMPDSFTFFYFATDEKNIEMINKVVNGPNVVRQLIRKVDKHLLSEFKDLREHKVDAFKLKGDLFIKQKGIIFNEQQEIHKKLQILKKQGIMDANSASGLELNNLSKQEINCLRIYMEDRNIKNIAKKLNIAVTTSTSYIENIKKKLNCHSKQELLKLADILASLGKI